MSERWKFVGHHAHFVSFAVVGWVDVFTRAVYAEFLLKNLAYCPKSKGLVLYEFVIMPSHVHLIAAAANANLGEIMRDFKTYTSKELVKLIAANEQESRKEWMLRLFKEHGAANPLNTHNQFWQQSNKPILLDTPKKFDDCVRYVRENPLVAGLVTDETAYTWSSANPQIGVELDEA
ncbi:MAG: transposase [Flavobacteriales bacterium]|nr:transposase [Flavobacteriales bacterium]